MNRLLVQSVGVSVSIETIPTTRIAQWGYEFTPTGSLMKILAITALHMSLSTFMME